VSINTISIIGHLKIQNASTNVLFTARVAVWCGVGSFGIIAPYFFGDDAAVTVNSAHYMEMLRNFVEPELRNWGIDLNTIWFQQHGATAHTARVTMGVLRRLFPRLVLSRNGDVPWPARSSDLTACDYWLWGYLKSKVYVARPANIEEFKQRIRDEIASIPGEMIRKVMHNLRGRLEQCVQNGGRHLSDVIFKT
jgi:hypothetical protein